MSSKTAAGYFPPTLVESLEPRIAPAVVINVGATTDSDPLNKTYNDAGTPFVPAASSSDAGIAALFAGSTDHYVLTLAPGDKVNMYDAAQGYKSFINVSSGKLLAFFQDKNPLDGGRVEAGDLTGFSLGSGAALTVAGSVDGDIVGNFNALTGKISTTSLLADTTSISSLNVAGGVDGSVIAGGSIGKLTIQGRAEQISTASDGTYSYHFGGTDTTHGTATLAAFTPASGKAGSNITGVTVGSIDKIVAGNGGSGGNGGAVSTVVITSDYDGFDIHGGNGGVGTKGGNGGAITGVTVYGAADPTPGPAIIGQITIAGGDGGTVAVGAGGAGGAVSKIYVGFQPSGTALVQSPIALNDYVTVSSGVGGGGSTAGGAGGLLSTVNVYTSAPNAPLINEIDIHGGHGGIAALGTGKGGAGGSVTGVLAVNLNDGDSSVPALRDQMLIAGGDAGAGAGSGAVGGSITGVNVLADQISVHAGNGSNGTTTGGLGGSITNLSFAYLPTDRVDAISILAGNGGTAVTAAAGAGGNITNVTGTFLDFVDLTNQVYAGNGGVSAGGIGGKGGNLGTISLFEPIKLPVDAAIAFHAGNGGAGAKTGGIGGSISSLTYLGYATLPEVHAGDGGSATTLGAGGNGGAITSLSIKAWNVNPAIGAGVVDVKSGAGGAGAGATGKGGNGGAITTATILATVTSDNTQPLGLDVNVVAGAGGGGGTGTVGTGGSITKLTASASQGNADVEAGSAGFAGAATKAAAGGSLSNVSISALGAVTLKAGDGRLGGAGGSISTAAWYGINAASGFTPDTATAPLGNVLVQAGQGSVGIGSTGVAGVGGSLSNLSGHAGATLGQTTKIFAGDGNGGVLGAKSAAGGSITGLNIYGGASYLEVKAGNGGSLSATSAGLGANGGNITGVASAVGVNFQYLAAGNGGNPGTLTGKGGLGGTINNVNVFNDIGQRSGSDFGMDSMGGLFAGAGGTGATPLLAGKAGNVTNITAAAIASIVAGRPTLAAPQDLQLVTIVDKVYLRGLDSPTIDAVLLSPTFGSFTNFGTANFVGGISGNPAAAGANDFKVDIGGISTPIGNTNPYPWTLGTTKPLDGLVAALSMTGNRNFRPGAFLTTIVSPIAFPTGYALADYRNNFNTNS